MAEQDISTEIIDEIERIKTDIFSGKLSIIDLELSPIFHRLKDSLNINNLIKYSRPFEGACGLLSDKFEELQRLLNTLDNEGVFTNFLKKSTSDEEIVSLFRKSWRELFHLESISLKFLNYSNVRYSQERKAIEAIEHLQGQKNKGDFLLRIPAHKFSEKMQCYFDQIINLLPCKFEDLFANEKDQLRLYEDFVYVLHLIQLGIIKFNKEKNLVYE